MALRQARRSAGVLPRLAARLAEKNPVPDAADQPSARVQLCAVWPSRDRPLPRQMRSSAPHSCWAGRVFAMRSALQRENYLAEIQQVAAELKLSSQCAHTLSGHHPPDCRELHLPAKDTLRHQFSTRELSLLSVSFFDSCSLNF